MKEGAFDEACKGATYVLHTGALMGQHCMGSSADCMGATHILHTGVRERPAHCLQ